MTKEELEKEAVEYAEKINLQNVNISGVVRNHISQAYLAGAEPREKRIAELEKENAELKKELEEADNATDCFNRQEEIIANAIEIIEGLMRFCRCFAQHHTEDIRYKDAEQFLTEVEK